MKKSRNWSPEEENYLEDSWGNVSIKGISRKLKRSVAAVRLKASRMKLDDARLHFDGITVNQLSHALDVSYSLLKNWIKLYDFPAKQKVFAVKNKVLVISYQDFWEWAEANKQMIDFARVQKHILGAEPDWVETKRNADIIKKRKINKSHNDAWDKQEDSTLIRMLEAFKYTYPDISKEIRRSEGAVKRRIIDLGLKMRPIRLNNHIKYTPEEETLIVDLLEDGHCLEHIARKIDKGALGVRGKLERMGYRFRNGVPYLKEIS